MKIETIPNKHLPKVPLTKERMDKYIPDVDPKTNILNLNGGRWVICGPPGSGKSNMLLGLFRSKQFYKHKFDNVYLFTPESSFTSVENHPFKNHDPQKLFFEINRENLQQTINELEAMKLRACECMEKKKEKKKQKKPQRKTRNCVYYGEDDEEEEDEEEDFPLQYSCVILDDCGDNMKDIECVKILKKFMSRSRHLMCVVIITLQSYLQLHKLLRKMINYVSIFKPINSEEWQSVAKELIGLKKNDALDLGDYVFDKKYEHLDINITDNLFFKSFNELKIQR